VYYNPNSPANLLCFHDLDSRFGVNWNHKEKTFSCKVPDGRVIHFRQKGKLYAFNPIEENTVLFETVADNAVSFTKRQIEDAKTAQALVRKLGYPSVYDVHKLISSGGILNCPVTSADLRRAIQIFGPDIGSLKGKTVTKKSEIAKCELIPRFVQSNIVLCADLMYINGIGFLVTVSENIGLTMIQHSACTQ
jgi:hypothetical protein